MPDPAGTGLTRRSVLLRSLGLGMAVYGGGAIAHADRVNAAINDALGEHRVLVSVFVDGGWDALSLLAPVGAAHLSQAQALRPKLLASIDKTQAAPFAADPSLAWHPAALAMRDMWDDPGLGVAVAPAIGYTGPNYSHFTSRHFWEVGSLDVAASTGWLGRYLDRVGKPNVPLQGVAMGGTLSPSLATARVPVSALADIDKYEYAYPWTWGDLPPQASAEIDAMGAAPSGDAERDVARMIGSASMSLVRDLSATAATTVTTTAPYPASSSTFAEELKDAARLLSVRVSGQALPVRALTLRAHGGYDTHAAQEPNFSNNIRITTQAIKAFWADLKARGQDDRVVMLVWSEFGRRPQENSSAGCDHGAAGAAFVIGKSVKQGLIGEFPGLKAYGTTGAGLMQDGNLRATSDFRGIYSALLEQWMGTDAEGIIPGAGLKPGSGAFARPVLF